MNSYNELGMLVKKEVVWGWEIWSIRDRVYLSTGHGDSRRKKKNSKDSSFIPFLVPTDYLKIIVSECSVTHVLSLSCDFDFQKNLNGLEVVGRVALFSYTRK